MFLEFIKCTIWKHVFDLWRKEIVRQIKRKLTTIGRSFVLMRLLQQYSGRGSNTKIYSSQNQSKVSPLSMESEMNKKPKRNI